MTPDPILLVPAAALIICAAIVRGYSGFGFSLLAITGLSLFYPPAKAIPAIFMLELAASLHLLPSIWREIHWRSLGWLMAGALLGTPVGVYALANFASTPMTIALAGFVLLAAALLWKGFALRKMPSAPATFAVGTATGMANGAFGLAGPPVILFYFASPAGHAAGRASLIAYFLFTDAVALGFLAREGLVTREAGLLALVFLPFLLAGVWLGARSFKSADPARFRKIVLMVVAVLALITAARAGLAL
jgi:uncharacterized membrane protein YfcA